MMKQLFTEISEAHPIFKSRMPLKLGIRNDLLRLYPGMSQPTVCKFMAFVCRHGEYLKNTIAGNHRFNLFSIEAGRVTQKEADYAAGLLEKRTQEQKKQPAPMVAHPEKKEPEKPVKKQNFATVLSLKKSA